MSKKKKAIEIIRILNNLYPNPVPPLNHFDPFSLLIAVLLSARCTDERVNQVTPKLFLKGKNVNEMSKLEIEEIREIIRPCGLSPTKAKNIKYHPLYGPSGFIKIINYTWDIPLIKLV